MHGGHGQDQDAFRDSLFNLGLGLGPGIVGLTICSRMVGMLRTKMLFMTPCALLVLVLVRALYTYSTRTWSNSSCGMRIVCVLGLTHHVECKSCGT